MPIEAPPTTPVSSGTGFTTTARLVDLSGTELASYGPFTTVILNNLDDGFPEIRSTVAPLTGGHGSVDTTQYFGARAITAVLTMPERPQTDTAVDSLRGLLAPGRRMWLYVQRPDWTTERRIQVRAASFACPPGVMRQAQVGWAAPAGIFEDSAISTATMTVLGNSDSGITLPITFPLTVASGLVAGAALVDVGGTTDATPQIDIYGPCSDPLVRVVGVGQIAFTGISIAAGDFLRVDMADRTVYLNGDLSQSRYQNYDFTTSTWWSLPVGTGIQVVFSAVAPSAGCKAVMTWRSRFI